MCLAWKAASLAQVVPCGALASLAEGHREAGGLQASIKGPAAFRERVPHTCERGMTQSL